MRVKISTNPPLPAIRAWFPLVQPSEHDQTIARLKSLLCTTLSAFRDISPSSLRLSIDGFELLDNSELAVVRDGDLISIDARDVSREDATVAARSLLRDQTHAPRPQSRPKKAAPTRALKRKRSPSLSPSSRSESDTESESSTSSDSSESDASTSTSGSESVVSIVSPVRKRPVKCARGQAAPAAAKLQPSTFVPPGYGKPQTRARNLRRRRRRMHECEGTGAPEDGHESAVGPDEPSEVQGNGEGVPALMSLSLRNKNKAKNMKALMKRPLPPKVLFEGYVSTEPKERPRLVPPSRRASLPRNVFVTSVDVEASDRNEHDDEEQDVTLDYGEPEVDVDKVEAMAKEQWDTLGKVRREMAPGTLLGYKTLGIDPVTFTPGPVLTVVRVLSCGSAAVMVRPLRAVSFNWAGDAEAEEHPWEEIDDGDWRML